MLEEQDDVFYYVTVMNENYAHPAMPAGAEEGILKGMYRLRTSSLPIRGEGKGGGGVSTTPAEHNSSAPAPSCAK